MRSSMKTGTVLGGLLTLAGCASYRPPTADVWGYQGTAKSESLAVVYTSSLATCQTLRENDVRKTTADWTISSACGPIRITAGNGWFAFSVVGDPDRGMAFSEGPAR